MSPLAIPHATPAPEHLDAWRRFAHTARLRLPPENPLPGLLLQSALDQYLANPTCPDARPRFLERMPTDLHPLIP